MYSAKIPVANQELIIILLFYHYCIIIIVLFSTSINCPYIGDVHGTDLLSEQKCENPVLLSLLHPR